MRNFSQTKRVVIKIGTSTLTKDSSVDRGYVRNIAKQVAALHEQGKQVVLVSSGAIGMGAMQLGRTQAIKETKMRQACAAIGQPLLMAEYKKAFARYQLTVGQVLLTAEVLDHRQTYLNLRNAIETLLKLRVVPIINENDCVSTEEIGSAFGDNDRLSALVASKIDADLLIVLTDIDALYDKNPRAHKDAQPITTVFEISDTLLKNAGDKGSRHATGGMKTKLEAARIAASAGCRVVLAQGRTKEVVTRIVAGDSLGTIFLPKQRLSNRQRWILNSKSSGTIRVDEGALQALRKRKSLLPSGIQTVEGSFEAGAVVLLNDNAKAVVSLSSAQIEALAGKHSTEIKKQLGPQHRDVIAIPEDIVVFD
ncbi:glutamate 5-kinase [Planctomycetota bacterium]